MRFKALPITSFEDITLDLEQVQAFLSNGDITVDSTGKLAVVSKVLGGKTPLAAANNLSDVASTVVALGHLLGVNRAVAVTGTLTWPGGSSFSNSVNNGPPGASGAVNGIAVAGGAVSGIYPTIIVVPGGAGLVSIGGWTPGGVTPTAGANCPYQALIWGS